MVGKQSTAAQHDALIVAWIILIDTINACAATIITLPTDIKLKSWSDAITQVCGQGDAVLLG